MFLVFRHYSMVTPIDLKLLNSLLLEKVYLGHQSMVIPIYWKLSECDMALGLGLVGHHSMVTPIDWKRPPERSL